MNRVAFWVNRSLKRKLLLPLLPLLLLGAALAVVTVWGIHAEFQNQMLERVRLRGELVANLINYAVESVSGPGELQRIVAAIGADEEVDLIVVVGGHPARVLASTRNAWLGQTLAELPVKEVGEDLAKALQTRQRHHHVHLESAMFDFTAPLLLSQPELADRSLTDGAVMVHLDMQPTQAAMRRLTIVLSATVLAGLTLLAAFGYGLIRHFILRPVARIGTLVELRPDGADGSWAEVATGDELGALARTLHDSRTRTGALLHEVEEQKNTLRESEARVRAIVDTALDAVVTMNADGRIIGWNTQAEGIFGWKREEAIGRSLSETIVPPQHREAHERGLKRFLASGHGPVLNKRIEITAMHRDGREFEVELAITPLKTDGRMEFSAFLRDISVRKRTEAELAKAHKELIDSSRRAGMAEVATGVLHNVGNVLNSVNVSATLLNESVRKSPQADITRVVALLREQGDNLGAFFTRDPRGPKVPLFLAQLADKFGHQRETQLKELESLVKNIGHIKQIVAMQQSFAKVSGVAETLQVTELVEDTLRMNAGSFQKHEVELVREFAADVPAITTDKHKVLQILVNLVRNAKHACEDARGTGKKVTVRVTHGEGRVKIQVSDNGMGIPAENLNRIFNHGFTTKKDGHGFGLHSGANAARELGGSLTVQSDGPGHGATFTLELAAGPAGPASAAPARLSNAA